MGRPSGCKPVTSPLATITVAPTWGASRPAIWAIIGVPASGISALSPPPMRRDLPPARITPAIRDLS
jgi:hypothetical protein